MVLMWRRCNSNHCLVRTTRRRHTTIRSRVTNSGNGGVAARHTTTTTNNNNNKSPSTQTPSPQKDGPENHSKRLGHTSFLSATILTLSDGSAGGGWSTAVSMFRKASGLQHSEASYSLSLGLLPLCLLYTGYGLLNDNSNSKSNSNGSAEENTTKEEDGSKQSSQRVDWSGAAVFASSLIAARAASGWLYGDTRTLVPKHPMVRTASNGVFSLLVIGVGCVSLQRSWEGYKVYTGGDKIVEAQQLQKNGIIDDSATATKCVHDRSERIKSYAVAGGTTGLGLFLLGPSALSFPVPLLVFLSNNNVPVSGNATQSTGLSPRQAFDTVLAGTIPYLCFNVGRMHRLGVRPKLSRFTPFAVVVGLMYGFAEEYILPNTPEYVAHGAFGLVALCGGGLKFVKSAKVVSKLSRQK